MWAEIAVSCDFLRALGAVDIRILAHMSSGLPFIGPTRYFTFSEIDFACIISKR
jgi:hypothetical protein